MRVRGRYEGKRKKTKLGTKSVSIELKIGLNQNQRSRVKSKGILNILGNFINGKPFEATTSTKMVANFSFGKIFQKKSRHVQGFLT